MYLNSIFSNICNLRDLNFQDFDIGYAICGTIIFIYETREQFFDTIHVGVSDFNLLTTWLTTQALTSDGQSVISMAEIREKDCRNHFVIISKFREQNSTHAKCHASGIPRAYLDENLKKYERNFKEFFGNLGRITYIYKLQN